MENAGNGISKPLDFKIFWGSMPPDPTYVTLATALIYGFYFFFLAHADVSADEMNLTEQFQTK